MRVICIDTTSWQKYPNTPRCGEVYEVERTVSDHCGRQSYVLVGFNYWGRTECKCGGLNNVECYNPARFIPLSEIDETELVNEKELIKY